MSDKKKNFEKQVRDNKKSFEEKLYDAFPNDWKPDFKPKEVDSRTASLSEIVEASGIRDIFKTFLVEEEDKKAFDLFLDGIINQRAEAFEQIRDGLGDNDKRLEIIAGLARATNYGKHS